MYKIILRFLILCLFTVTILQSTALFVFNRNASRASEIENRTKLIAEQTCHPTVSSTWFIHDGKMYVVCYSDKSIYKFSIEQAKYQEAL